MSWSKSETTRANYVYEKNLATIVDVHLSGDTTKTAKGSKIKDSGVYEIEFSYSVRKSDLTATPSNPHFFIGFGDFVDKLGTIITHKTLVRLGADNNMATQNFPNQRAVKVWVVKPDDTEMDFMCSESASTANWAMYNINAVAKKIADV